MLKLWPWLAMTAMGMGWGMTFPLTKIAVDAGYQPWGLVFWQVVFSSTILGLIVLMKRQKFRIGGAQLRIAVFIAFSGTIFPNTASYRAAAELPAGMMAILIATVAMFSYPIAILMGVDRLELRRLVGLFSGILAVVLLSWPDLTGPTLGQAPFILLALVAPFFYAIEGNVVARYGTAGLDPVQTLFLASCIGMFLMGPMAIISGQFVSLSIPFSTAHWSILAIGVIHALVYSSYVWILGKVGSVFASQVSYLVTIFGVIFSSLVLSEAYPNTLWLALIVIFVGMALVQPRAAPTAY